MVFDVIVVGAGPAGATAARYAAKGGLRVLILDREHETRIGDKVCGNGLGSHHLEEVELVLPSETNYGRLRGTFVDSPSGKVRFTIEAPEIGAIMLDRLRFGQYLVKLASDAGAQLLADSNVTSAIIEDNKVIGVRGVNVKTMAKFEYKARVTIEASGAAAVLRRSMGNIGLDSRLDDDETLVTYREIREVSEQIDQTYAYISLDQTIAPDGYWWAFPLGEGMINVGLGAAKGQANPRERYETVLKRYEPLRGSKLIHSGGGVVPTRRPMSNMVWNGIMFIGDAGFTVGPLHGGGIGSSMLAGKIAGEVSTEASVKDDCRITDLWGLNARYMLAYGAKQASMDVFRIFLQSLDNELINYGMENHLVTERDLMAAFMGDDLQLNITDKAQRFFSGIGKIGFLLRLKRTVDLMKRTRRAYLGYPEEPCNFDAWNVTATSLHNMAHA